MKLFGVLTNPRWSAALFIVALMAFYAAAPLLVNYFLLADPYFVKLAQLCTLACVAIAIGFCTPLLDFQFRPGAKRVVIDSRVFHLAIWGTFAAFLLITLATAEAIPLFSAFQGASERELSDQRGALLKATERWKAALNYIGALFTVAVLPYSLALLFLERSRFRWGALALFLFYCESFLEKSLFVRVVVPQFYLVAQRKIWNYAGLVTLIFGCVGLIYLNTVLAKGTEPGSPSPRALLVETISKIPGKKEAIRPDDQQPRSPAPEHPARLHDQQPRAPGTEQAAQPTGPSGRERPPIFTVEFLKASYTSYGTMGPLDLLAWRIFAVPIFTAADALRVFDQKFDGRPLWGATSTLLSSTFRLERVPFEAYVHGHQWGDGGPNPIGRSNSVFVTEAFINYGWVGVIVFALFVGQSLRWFYKSHDDAFKSIWLLYVFGLFGGGLLGGLFSGGLLLLFLVGLFGIVTKPAAGKVARRAQFRMTDRPAETTN